MATSEPAMIATAGGQARQVNIAGDNFGPLYLASEHSLRAVHQLPYSAADFIGRANLYDALLKRLLLDNEQEILNIYGIPGVGKSALAIRLSNELAETHYPDCQLYFNLRESDGSPVTSHDLLGGALVSLGVPRENVPASTSVRAAIFRSAIASRRSVILIDNATTSADVSLLLPGKGRAAVLVTSWAPIAELPGVYSIALQTLTDGESLQMLRRVGGGESTPTDLAEMREIARLAGNLPLALRIIGGLRRTRTHLSWSDLRYRLTSADGAGRLDRLVAGELAVEKVFDLAYRNLDPDVARGYRLLGLAPSAQVTQTLAHALVSSDAEVAQEVIDELLSRQLIQIETRRTYRMHDLVWQRARSLASNESDSVRRAATERMIDWALDQIGSSYLSRFRSNLSLAAPFNVAVEEQEIEISYVDSPIEDFHSGQSSFIGDMFPSTHRLLLVGEGGSGKTTMIDRLSQVSAERRVHDADGPIPMVALFRDIAESSDCDVTALLLQTMRLRYGVDVTLDALMIALRQSRIFVVLDGLDELLDRRLRSATLSSIKKFTLRYPSVPLLITTRPYAEVGEDFPGFRHAMISPWTRDLCAQYTRNLLPANREKIRANTQEIVEAIRASVPADFFARPLGVQMALSVYSDLGKIPPTRTAVTEAFIQRFGIERERERGLLGEEAHVVRHILERVAFSMQSNEENRVSIGFSDLRQIARKTLHEVDNGSDHYGRSSYVMMQITERSGIFQETGWRKESSYAFRHTAFREHLAASYLARKQPPDFALEFAGRAHDASWLAVLRAALEIASERQGDVFVEQLARVVKGAGSAHLLKTVSDWQRRR
ncbi:NACHT domain-containing protein [Solwaraspora sp. WMMD1047]|uniref:NACHT domain-containing protein n=1 Tax=Solwaraspora sp. WMMD1047 TaxID=3016102 RepID=UPI0024161AFF|nr:NACHT domain-containing protein [Solwaraspora sp. WMMD1047]MDG4834842.1 NACHT domain-containing protein [Solwaraspora sp. WMMD1047]